MATNDAFKCKKPGFSVGNFGLGLLHSFDSLSGGLITDAVSFFSPTAGAAMSTAINPLGNAKGKLNNAIKKINSQQVTDTLAFSKLVLKEQQQVMVFQAEQKELLDASMNQMNEELWDAIETENTFMSLLSIMVLVVIFMILIKPSK